MLRLIIAIFLVCGLIGAGCSDDSSPSDAAPVAEASVDASQDDGAVRDAPEATEAGGDTSAALEASPGDSGPPTDAGAD
jgi:hypothetical protein